MRDPQHVTVAQRLRRLDDRVLERQPSASWVAHGRRYGWIYFGALGSVVLGICGWALASDRPVIFTMNIGLGCVYIAAAGFYFRRRQGG
jgi:hypothetical protein